MEIRTERTIHGITQYIKETKKATVKSVEKASVYTHDAVEMADGEGEQINYLV
jgi:hypothetical protein